MMRFEEIKKNVQKGDVILSYNTENLLSLAIATVTESKWSHVFLYLGSGNILESVIGGVQISPLKKYFKPYYNLCLLRHKHITRRDANRVTKSAVKYVGYDYGYLQLFWYLFLRLIKRSEDPMWQMDIEDSAMVCSEAIAQAYQDVGLVIKPGFKPAGMEPADFYESPFFDKIVEVIDDGN